MPIVPTMFSFATSPVKEATVACQVPKPRGAKIHASAEPTFARIERLSSSFPSIRKPSAVQPKKEVNQTTIVESRITVPAFFTKDQPRSQVERRTVFTVGRW